MKSKGLIPELKIVVSQRAGLLHVDFNVPVTSFTLPREDALNFAMSIMRKCGINAPGISEPLTAKAETKGAA